MAAAVLVGGGPLFVSQAGSSAVLVATLVGGHNGSRFVDALVGGGVGLAVLVAVPINPLKRSQRAGALVFTELAGSLEDVAAAIEARDVALGARGARAGQGGGNARRPMAGVARSRP